MKTTYRDYTLSLNFRLLIRTNDGDKETTDDLAESIAENIIKTEHRDGRNEFYVEMAELALSRLVARAAVETVYKRVCEETKGQYDKYISEDGRCTGETAVSVRVMDEWHKSHPFVASIQWDECTASVS